MRRSLRFRLFAGALAGIAIALVVAGLFIAANFAASISRERRSDLEAGLRQVLAQIDPDVEPPVADQLANPRFDQPLSGYYWQVDDIERGSTYRSRSLWDAELSLVATGRDGDIWLTTGPGEVPLIALARVVDVEGSDTVRTFRVIVAEAREDPDSVFERFAGDLTLALACLAVVLAAVSWVQITLGLEPLRLVALDVERVRRAELDRMPARGPSEVLPLVSEVNNVLDAYESTTTNARERAANLAHGLKTPLAVISATAERMRESDRQNAEILRLVVEEMDARIEYELRLARLRMRPRTHSARASLNTALLRNVAVLRRTERGEHLSWMVELDEELDLDLDEHDLLELTGVLLENACKWARSSVSVEGRRGGRHVHLVVEDDGEGVGDDEIEKLGDRGTRLDETRPGDGIGLSIVFDVVKFNGGSIDFGRSARGGLKVLIRLPLADI